VKSFIRTTREERCSNINRSNTREVHIGYSVEIMVESDKHIPVLTSQTDFGVSKTPSGSAIQHHNKTLILGPHQK
jgi:hypothetical protein